MCVGLEFQLFVIKFVFKFLCFLYHSPFCWARSRERERARARARVCVCVCVCVCEDRLHTYYSTARLLAQPDLAGVGGLLTQRGNFRRSMEVWRQRVYHVG